MMLVGGGVLPASAAVTIDLEASEAEKAALETRISLLKRERRRLEAELTRELAAAGKTPPPTSIMQQPSLVEAASSASASDTGPYHGSGSVANTHAGGVGHAAWSAADAPVTGGRKRKREGKAPAAISGPAQTGERPHACPVCDMRFRLLSTCTSHEQTHASKTQATAAREMPHACSVCPMHFSRESTLARHALIHQGKGPGQRRLPRLRPTCIVDMCTGSRRWTNTWPE